MLVILRWVLYLFNASESKALSRAITSENTRAVVCANNFVKMLRYPKNKRQKPLKKESPSLKSCVDSLLLVNCIPVNSPSWIPSTETKNLFDSFINFQSPLPFMPLLLLLLLFSYSKSHEETCGEGLRIALHAQANSVHDKKVLGSEITCRGFADAFQSQNQHNIVTIMSPSNYSMLATYQWDFVLIEGWFPAIQAFIHEIRRHSKDHVRVYFFCLDPFFPGIPALKQLDVDVYFTNSRRAQLELNDAAPSEFLLLAAPEIHDRSVKFPHYQHNVVFVGSAFGLLTKQNLRPMLREAMPFGLVIYGDGWGRETEFQPYWKGILPTDHLIHVYLSSKVVLGVTMDPQKEYGMINNRVFEVLASGAAFITDHFPELEAEFGDAVLYYRKPGDVTRHLTSQDQPDLIDMSQHTYSHRIQQILNIHASARVNERNNQPSIAVISDQQEIQSSVHDHLFKIVSINPALAELKKSYRVVHLESSDLDKEFLNSFSFLLVLSAWEGAVDDRIRKLFGPDKPQCRSGLLMLRPVVESLPEDAMFYDVIYFSNPNDAESLHKMTMHSQYAFGLDIAAFKSSQEEKMYDVMLFGDWTDSDRMFFALQLTDQSKVAFILPQSFESSHIKRYLEQYRNAVVYTNLLDVHTFSSLLDQTNHVYIPCQVPCAADVLVAASAVMNVSVSTEDDNSRLALYKQGGVYVGNALEYAESIRHGFARALTLGRSDASVEILQPRNGDKLIGHEVLIRHEIQNFKLQFDGYVCLYANGNQVGCLSQNEQYFAVAGQLPAALDLQLVLRGTLYSEVLFKTPVIQVTVIFQTPANPTPDPLKIKCFV